MARLMAITEIVSIEEMRMGETGRKKTDSVRDFKQQAPAMPDGVYFLIEGGRVMRVVCKTFGRPT
jgi:hypothetical protein